MFSLFIVYHKVLYDKFYETITKENQKYIIFYGVKDKVEHTPLQLPIIYEYELPVYNSELQEKRFNEASAFYHIYTNQLYNHTQYIGFFQYDMCIDNVSLNQVKDTIQTRPNKSTIFSSFYAIDESKHDLCGSLRLLTEPMDRFGSLLDNYNTCFSKRYTLADIIQAPWIMCNTFIIPCRMYEKYMSWISTYLLGEIDVDELCRICYMNSGFLDSNITHEDRSKHINRGHIIEICTALFLAIEFIEGSDICHIKLDHMHDSRV